MISDIILQRKSPRKMADVMPEALQLLNRGEISTLNLPEWLSVDHAHLIRHLMAEIGENALGSICANAVTRMPKRSVLGSIVLIGKTLAEKNQSEVIAFLGNHTSDSARSYAVCAIGANARFSTEETFSQAKKFAADLHFGVREMAWLGLRHRVESNLEDSIAILAGWASESDANVRRFASEITRPRGVWCRHLTSLKARPEQALGILEPLKSDPSKYVRDSVANWLNDAAKSCPEFVLEICSDWERISPTKETEYIIRRALRTIRKNDL